MPRTREDRSFPHAFTHSLLFCAAFLSVSSFLAASLAPSLLPSRSTVALSLQVQVAILSLVPDVLFSPSSPTRHERTASFHFYVLHLIPPSTRHERAPLVLRPWLSRALLLLGASLWATKNLSLVDPSCRLIYLSSTPSSLILLPRLLFLFLFLFLIVGVKSARPRQSHGRRGLTFTGHPRRICMPGFQLRPPKQNLQRHSKW